MYLLDKIRLATDDLKVNRFSLVSNLIAVSIGIGFLGALLSLTIGVSEFLENYYTRTMSLETIRVFYAPETGEAKPFTPDVRRQLMARPGIDYVLYHDVDFVTIQISPEQKADVAVLPAITNDPEIERLERVAGGNLTQGQDANTPGVVISLARAQKLSDLPPADLIGTEIAVTFLRSLRIEDEPETQTVYARIDGIVQESPDEAIYLPYQILAAAHLWQHATDSVKEFGVDDTDATHDETVATILNNPESQHTYRFARILDAYKELAPLLASDEIVYPHLRIHCRDLDSLIAIREEFRRSGIPTSAVLDDIKIVRELRQYALAVFGLISGITLLAAVCSIFNTLLAAVQRRTREIGVLRSLGASVGDVLTIFLLQGTAIGVMGSCIAVVGLFVLSRQLNAIVLERLAGNPEFERLVELNPEFFAYPGWLPVVVIAIGSLAACGSALWPSIKAATILPAEALRQPG